MKKFLIFIAAMFAAAMAFGQTPLPNDPEVRVGKLENGLTYYIRHNDKPAQRAEFYLATNVGAFQEEDDQDGLAHFLEHMCFNGTKNFPGDYLLEWLRSIGAEFGRNINASTGFEQTQYMLNNIPLIRETVIDSCLLVLHDYSHFVTCDPAEIDAERGVILEERRTRRDASWRMFEKSLPYYYGDTPYAKRTLIGGEEQLKTFKYESLTNFYKKWYNPDMQAVIVVGDVDVDQVEAKIRSIFSDIPAPAVPTEKIIHKIPDNAEPVIAVITDPEATSSSIETIWRSEPMPREFRNTDIGYMTDVITTYITLIMNERFQDITAQPDAPFIGASFSIGRLCAAADMVNGTVSFKDGEAVKGFTAFMTEVEKMKRFGFTEGEVQRAKDNIVSYYEKAVEAAATRKNAEFVRPIINNFFHNEPYMDPATELQIIQMLCSQINAQILGQVAAGIITDENLTVIYTGPEKEGLANPTTEEIQGVLSAVKSAEIEANVEENLNEPFLDASKLKGSKVKKTTEGIHGSTVWTLKNGITVRVLPTQHKNDQILFDVNIDGGKTLVPTEDLAFIEDNIWSIFLSNSGISKFSGTQTSKMLAGKNLNVSPYIGKYSHGVQGSSTPKDLETALQILYLYFAEPRFDENEYQTGIQQIKAILPNIEKNPSFKFQQIISDIAYGNNPRVVQLNGELLDKVNLAGLEKVYRMLFSNAAKAEVSIVGNVDLNTLKPLVEKYIGSIPTGKKAHELKVANLVDFVSGKVIEESRIAMETPKSTVLHLYTADMPMDVNKEVTLEVANYILDMIYTKSIREDEGGTYGVGTAMVGQKRGKNMAMIQVQFDTNPEMYAKLSDLAVKGLDELAKNGPTEEQMSMAIENFKKNIPESRISNSHWLNVIEENYLYGNDYDTEYEAAVNSVTAEDIKTLLSEILASGNFISITLLPQE